MLHDTPKYLNSSGPALKVNGDKYIGSAIYDIAGSTLTQPTDSAILMRFSVNRTFTLPSGLTDSKAESTVAPTAQVSYTIKKNNVSIGSLDFAIATNDATFTFATQQSFAVGDILTVEVGTADATHDEISWTFSADLT